jgi:hypothetical protein
VTPFWRASSSSGMTSLAASCGDITPPVNTGGDNGPGTGGNGGIDGGGNQGPAAVPLHPPCGAASWAWAPWPRRS